MAKLCAFLILGIIASQATCMSLRDKRQTGNNPDDFEDRYGWDRPGNSINRPDRFPIQNIFPQQNPFDINTDFIMSNFPSQAQFMGQGQLPMQTPFINQQQFPNQQRPQNQQQFPNQQQPQNQQPRPSSTTTLAPSTSGATTLSSSVQECIRLCPVTSEYNPVCGSDSVTYTNPGRLTCAQSCGVNVNLSRQAPCPPATSTEINIFQ